MTVQECLMKVDMLKPNRYDRPTKVMWLAEIEGQIFNEVVLTHESPPVPFPKIDQNVDPDHRLIAPFPYDDLYVLWLSCQIDLGNMEIGKYNNDKTLFNNALMTFRDYWNRTFMPRERAHAFRFNDRHHHHRHGYDVYLFEKEGPLGGEG